VTLTAEAPSVAGLNCLTCDTQAAALALAVLLKSVIALLTQLSCGGAPKELTHGSGTPTPLVLVGLVQLMPMSAHPSGHTGLQMLAVKG
jgi:hypothetical protein